MGARTRLVCKLCGSTDIFRSFITKGSYGLVRCVNCGFVFIPEDNYSQTDIRKSYVDNEVSKSEYYISTGRSDLKHANRLLSRIEFYSEPGFLLDIGCNVGSFMIAARDKGWRTLGVEPNPAAANEAIRRGLEVDVSFFDDIFVEEHVNKFDVAHLGDVLEHVFDPLNFLSNIVQVIKAGGFLALTTPNVASFWGKRYHIKPFEHLVYFNLETAKFALERVGLEVLVCERCSRPKEIENLEKRKYELGVLERNFINVARILRLNSVINRAVDVMIKDEILAIGRKGLKITPGL